MKNTKWIWRVLAVLLALVVLAGVGFAGFRIGMMQNVNLSDGTNFGWHSFDGNSPHGFGHNMRGFDHGRDFGGRGGFSFFSPIFGLIRLAIFGGLIWLGYTLVKKSGWRVVNVNATQSASAPAPAVVEETPSAEVDEKKDEA